jgi:hypothetical protein
MVTILITLQSSHIESQKQRSCLWISMTIVSDSLRNGRAGSRTIYQHGADVNVLFRRRVAVANTQSQHRSRKKWRIDTASCFLRWSNRVAAPVLCSRKISIGDRTAESLHAVFSDSDSARSLEW